MTNATNNTATAYNHNTAHEAHVLARVEHELALMTEGEHADVIEAPATFAGGKIYAPRSAERRAMFTEHYADGTSQHRYCRDLDARGTATFAKLSDVPAGEFGDSIMDPDTLGFFRATVMEARLADRERGAICNGGQLDSRKRVRKTTRTNAKPRTRAEKAAAIRARRAQ